MTNCYLCGTNNATQKLILKDTFTAHSLAKCPESNKLCNRCEYSINLIAYYWNENKIDKKTKKHKPDWSKIYARNWSWLYQNKTLIFPAFNGEKDGLPIIETLPTREMIRDWLVNPPEPPFTIAIAESGQKHILFLAQTAYNKEVFPVQFELDTVIIFHKVFLEILKCFEQLMLLGATKTEILSGNYKSQFLLNNLGKYEQFEYELENKRGSRLLELASYVAIQKQDISKKENCSELPVQSKPIGSKPQQLSLF